MTVSQHGRAELDELNADFAANRLMPLWTQRNDVMPLSPQAKAVRHPTLCALVNPLTWALPRGCDGGPTAVAAVTGGTQR